MHETIDTVLQIRVGIHSGVVMSGLIGVDKLMYGTSNKIEKEK